MGMFLAKLMGLFCNQEHKVIIVGLDNAGKTTILYQFLMNEVVHTSPTIGSNVEEIVVKNTHFLMWDIGGQDMLRSMWSTYYTNTELSKGPVPLGRHLRDRPVVTVEPIIMRPHSRLECMTSFEYTVYDISPVYDMFVILVVDSTDRERLTLTKEELYKMLAHEDLRKAAVLVFANKQDMMNSMSAAEISRFLTLTSIKDHPWHIQACCALTGEGLGQGLEWMTMKTSAK